MALLLPASIATGGVPTQAQLAGVRTVVEAEYWKVGGPSADRLREIYCRAVRGGSSEVREAVDEAMRDLAKRHWVNPAVFSDCLDEADGLALESRRPASAKFSDATRPMRTLIALAELPRDQRLELYKGVIGAGKPLFGALERGARYAFSRLTM